MSGPAIVAERLGKRYRIGARPPVYRTLRDAVSERLRAGRPERPSADRTIWALKDVSAEIAQGEAVGVIGANGAGKTTLLKLISGITEPTTGRAFVRGRVGSLLEVGTGFHPELTGRENIFLNGAILGMRRSEIVARFDDIVAFAEIEPFVDTPVKRYSSGMYVRLAFAVAAHLEADILLVDEVLAVGDLAFQRKCLGKMQTQTEAEGRTVLFVSHNLASIRMLTERCLWLERGRVRELGATGKVFRNYVRAHATGTGSGRAELSDGSTGRPPGKALEQNVLFDSVELHDPDGHVTDAHLEGEPIAVRLSLRCVRPVTGELELLSRIRTLEGVFVFSALGGRREVRLEPGRFRTSFSIDPNPLRPGVYELELYSLTRVAQDLVPAAIMFRVEPNVHPDDDPRYAGPLDLGLVRADYRWSPLESIEAGDLLAETP